FNLVRATFDDEDVAIRRGEKKSRVTKSTGVQFNLETGRNSRSRIRRPVCDTRRIDREEIRSWLWQILHRDFAPDTRRIACPVAHRRLAREEFAIFSCCVNRIRDVETDRNDRDVQAKTSAFAVYHCLESLLVRGSRALGRRLRVGGVLGSTG